MKFEVKRLSVALIPEYLKFFDDIAFADNPDWSKCYCCHNFFLSEDVDVDTRAYAQKMIKEGKLNGFLAFDNGVPVGWCNCGDIRNYPRIMENPYAAEILDKTVALVCFTVDHKRRREGIATQLIEKAIETYRAEGYQWMDASSYKLAKSDAENYFGPKKLYVNKGFEIVGQNDKFYIMRKALNE